MVLTNPSPNVTNLTSIPTESRHSSLNFTRILKRIKNGIIALLRRLTPPKNTKRSSLFHIHKAKPTVLRLSSSLRLELDWNDFAYEHASGIYWLASTQESVTVVQESFYDQTKSRAAYVVEIRRSDIVKGMPVPVEFVEDFLIDGDRVEEVGATDLDQRTNADSLLSDIFDHG
ncbi:hypothetical protein B0H19DRAFT_1060810 [Mycena capillaripes]|nr:hypothetical protein B0H19DRAFT_1060810 [Mycena capillaripes]